MEFVWDEEKRRQTIALRDVDILKAARIFERPVIRFVDERQDYGEVRYRAVGMVGDDCFVVVYTQREGSVRLITAWKGGRDERARYQAGVP